VGKHKTLDATQIAGRLALVEGVEVKTKEKLAPYTSYKIGGPTAVWAAPGTEAAIGEVLKMVQADKIPLFILGLGSNLLISDNGWPGVTLYLGSNMSGWHFDSTIASVRARSPLLDLIRHAVDNGLGGMELMAGIPGSVGGALRMNAGAFGQEMAQTTVNVKGFRLDGTPFTAAREDVNFGYRQVPDLEQVVLTSAEFRFEQTDAATLKQRMNDILALRAKKQPLDFPSCGSVFKRPPGYYAGALIDEAGLKGMRVGGAMISPKHAGFILNTDNACAADVLDLIRKIEDRVWQRFGVKLEREVKLIGEFHG
jgi:UDP-N-acetylmuramate dehydrogenase